VNARHRLVLTRKSKKKNLSAKSAGIVKGIGRQSFSKRREILILLKGGFRGQNFGPVDFRLITSDS